MNLRNIIGHKVTVAGTQAGPVEDVRCTKAGVASLKIGRRWIDMPSSEVARECETAIYRTEHGLA